MIILHSFRLWLFFTRFECRFRLDLNFDSHKLREVELTLDRLKVDVATVNVSTTLKSVSTCWGFIKSFGKTKEK